MSNRNGTLPERERAALAALVLAAFLLRLPGLAGDAPWIDESASIGLGGLPWGVVFGEMARIEASPPGYYAIAGVLGRLGLAGPVPLRLLSAAAAALSVLPVFLFTKTAFGARAAWVAAATVALHASLIRHGQDGRTYALLFLLFACALLAALRLVLAARAGRGGAGAVAALALAQGAMLWLHHTAAIANLALNLFVLVALAAGGAGLARGLARLAAADALAVALAAAPVLWALGHAGDGAFVTRWIAPPGPYDATLLYVHELVAPFHSPVSALTLLVSAGALLLALGMRAEGAPERRALLALLSGAGLLFPLLSQRWPVMIDRTVLFLLAPLAAVMAAGLALLPRRAFLAAAALLLALHAFGALRFHLLAQTREDWNGAAALLAERRAPGEAVLVTDSVFALLSLGAAFAIGGQPPPPALLLPATSPLETRSAELLAPEAVVAASDLCARLAGAPGAWLVTRPVPPPVAEDPAFSTLPLARAALAAGGAAPTDMQARGGILLERWRPPAAC